MLETGRLLDLAREQSGLRDFGDEWFIEPLGWLVDSINHESKLTPVGQQAIPGTLIRYLVNRLEVEHWYKLHAEIDDEEIVAPVFGLGLPRTGSTALGHIMSLDPKTRVLRKWESERPCPPPEAATQHTDPRIAISQAAEDEFIELLPEIVDMLPRGVTSPTECAYPLMESFSAGSSFELFIHVPTYARKTLSPEFDMVPAYRYHQRLLKLLQWRCPPKRWYLRTPVHTFEIDSLSAVYPDARFVMTHRDPLKSLPSVCSLIEHHRRVFVDNPEPHYLGPTHQRYWVTALERTLDFRARVGEERFFDVSHRRQVIDPVEQVRTLYDTLGWEFDDDLEDRIRVWQETHPRGRHSYSLEHFGLDPAEISRDYRFYTERFASLL